MRKTLLFSIIFLININVYPQYTFSTPVNQAQEKRQVWNKWGDWNYGMRGLNGFVWKQLAWGALAPRKNKRYKNGSDIRPLKIDGEPGEELKRHVAIKVARENAEKLKVKFDSINARSRADFLHWTGLIAKVDPLYLLYYKRKLKPYVDFPINPQTQEDWGIKDSEVFELMRKTGTLDILREELDEINDMYFLALGKPAQFGSSPVSLPNNPSDEEGSFEGDWDESSNIFGNISGGGSWGVGGSSIQDNNEDGDSNLGGVGLGSIFGRKASDMPRGKRLILIHKTFIKWRNFKKKLDNYSNNYINIVKALKVDKEMKIFYNQTDNWRPKSDLEIIQAIIDANLNRISYY